MWFLGQLPLNSQLFLGNDWTDLGKLGLVWKLKYGHGSSVNGSWWRLLLPEIWQEMWFLGWPFMSSHLFLNRFEPSWARLKATLWSPIKFKCTMASTSGSGYMTEKVIYMPTLPGEKHLSMIRERHYHITRWIKKPFFKIVINFNLFIVFCSQHITNGFQKFNLVIQRYKVFFIKVASDSFNYSS